MATAVLAATRHVLFACGQRHAYANIAISIVPPADIATDLRLLQRIVARDDLALAELYDRHSRLAFSVIRCILRSPSDAEEVLRETFVRVWSRGDSYDERLGSPVAWLTRIARNRAIDRLRAKRARANVDVQLDNPSEPESKRAPELATSETPEVLIQDSAVAGTVRGALATLPVAQRELIEAAFFEDYTHQELASRFGVPLGTIKTRIRTGLTSLRGRLEHAV